MRLRTLFAQGLTLGEGPRWCHDGLWWVDIIRGLLFHSRWQNDGFTPPQQWDLLAQVGMIGALAPLATGGLVLATQQGWQHFDPVSGRCTPLANPCPDPQIRCNDGAVDPAGRFITGTMPLDMAPGQGCLWSLDPDGRVRQLMSGLTCPNGLAWNAAGNEMAFIDSPQRAIGIYAYDVQRGIVGQQLRRIAVDNVAGVPDGCCLDQQGTLWVAFWGGGCVRGYDFASGELRQHLSCPCSQITACALAGPLCDHLVITSAALDCAEPEAGNCFVMPLNTVGWPAAAWAGDLPGGEPR
ncbi:MAG: SMP-30/gluconolactonase/LRE family protein [Planctomycetota bacterium]|nr:MAG: SMP-30/gluconolactonase/LRE family protein [Planctomycetota bacterium]